MPDDAIATLGDNERPVYRNDCRATIAGPDGSRCKRADTTRSMLEKGCSPGNAAYEGFFGRLKNELFHSKNWEDVTFDGLSRLPDERIEKSLGHMSPNNTVGAYAQRFRRVRGNRPRPPGVWMNLEINWPRRCRILCVETRVSAPLGVSFALGCDSTEGLLRYESR